MFGGKSLEGSYGDGLVYFTAAAIALTGVKANTAQDSGKRNLLPDHSQGWIILTLTDEANITRDINANRAGGGTWDKCGIALSYLHYLFIHQGTGGAYLNTRSAEAAGRIPQSGFKSAHKDLSLAVNKANGFYPPQVSTGPHTPETTNT